MNLQSKITTSALFLPSSHVNYLGYQATSHFLISESPRNKTLSLPEANKCNAEASNLLATFTLRSQNYRVKFTSDHRS